MTTNTAVSLALAERLRYRCPECHGTNKVREHPYMGGYMACPSCDGGWVYPLRVQQRALGGR